jgi:hypothetical protein
MSPLKNPRQQVRTVTLDNEVMGRLSQNARSVLALAQRYAQRLGVLHMEHLFFALVDLDMTSTQKLLKRSGADRERLVNVLSATSKFDVPIAALQAGELIMPVRMSAHVAEAINKADEFRAANNRKTLRTRHLLVGLLSVSNCAVVEQLAIFNINQEEALIVVAEDKQGGGVSGDKVAVRKVQANASDQENPFASVSGMTASSAFGWKAQGGGRFLPLEQVPYYRDKLIGGTDDERQAMVDRIAAESAAMDLSLLRNDLVEGLRSGFPGYIVSPEARSWIVSALGCMSSPEDTEVVTLLQVLVDPTQEKSELVRFWSLLAWSRVTGSVPEILISPSEPSGPVRMLEEALGARGTEQVPSSILLALQDTNDEYLLWSALLTLRIVAFPSLIPQMCELLQQVSKNPTSPVPYNVLLALANPEIIDEAARALESSMGTHGVVENAVKAMRNSSLRRVSEFTRVAARLDKRGVERSLNGFAASPDEHTAQAAHVLMERLGLEVEEIAPVAGYVTDSIPNPDQDLKDEVGINKDVKTLCSVLLAVDVKPPLAVGLFGDWGTGKSYFMEKMYREIKSLAKRAEGAEKTAYHSRVVQIRFNAWHYADANLWASLVTHIFDELSREVCPAEDPEETKRKIMLQLESAKQVRMDAETEKDRAKVERSAAESSLDEARNKRQAKQVDLANLRMPELLEILSEEQQRELKKELGVLFDELGLPPALNSVQELNEAYHEAYTLAGRVQATFVSLWRAKDRTTLIILLVAVFVVVPGISYLIQYLTNIPGLAGVNAVIGDIAVAVGGFAVEFKKHLGKASGYLKNFEEARARVLKVIAQKREEVSKEELALQQELEKLKAHEDKAQLRLLTADTKVRELEQKLEEIKSGRSLSKFLLERVQAEDYRKHLGIISLIRKDFERLDDLLSRGDEGLEKIGRIILYIDDLDRCPADKVVDVLQATHLLLAMPLFVAVVGVDLRWLLHSLDHQYTAFHAERNDDPRGVRPEWITSPQSYLEKIFQIPFNLKPMEGAGYGRLINSLFPKAADPVAAKAGPQAYLVEPALQDDGVGKTTYSGHDPEPGTEPQPTLRNADIPKQTAEVVDRDLDPAALVVRDWEREFAARMFPFVPSPRAAKRFTNIYRILKAPLANQELREFEGTAETPGEFQAAMLLLAMTTGLPQETAELFRDILVEGEKSRQGGQQTRSWKDVLEKFIAEPEKQAVFAQLKLDDRIDPFFKWAPRVGQFTFEAAKAAAKRAGAPKAGATTSHAGE